MSYQERIYAKCGFCAERNSTTRSVNMSSDLYIFNRPFYNISGATKIDCITPPNSGLTSGDTGVYIISNQTGITFNIIFTANTESFTDLNESKFNYSVYKYNTNLGVFNNQPLYNSDIIEWSSFSATSATTQIIPINNLTLDGDYILKGNFTNKFATEFANLLGDQYNTNISIVGDNYGVYQSDRDFYFVALKEADEPILSIGTQTAAPVGAFIVYTRELVDKQTDIQISEEFPTYLVALNGLALAENYDYVITGITNGSVTTTVIRLLNQAVNGDILTILLVGPGANSKIVNKIIDVSYVITSGVTGGQGSNDVYYNTTTGKYELYVDTTPINGNDILITLNGAILANNIDYYQSVTDPKRLILEGMIITGDIINIYYNGFTNLVGELDSPTPNISWSISNPPINDSGIFTVEVSSASTFNNLVTSGSVNYVVGEINYNYTLGVPGKYGDNFYYRIKNEKRYRTLCNSIVSSVKYSEVIPITLRSNFGNSY
jgi:hypothetical protein